MVKRHYLAKVWLRMLFLHSKHWQGKDACCVVIITTFRTTLNNSRSVIAMLHNAEHIHIHSFIHRLSHSDFWLNWQDRHGKKKTLKLKAGQIKQGSSSKKTLHHSDRLYIMQYFNNEWFVENGLRYFAVLKISEIDLFAPLEWHSSLCKQ